jgi:hypothetical protein
MALSDATKEVMARHEALRTADRNVPRPPIPLYTGPTVPSAYDAGWQRFTNLTQDQIAWFQAQPEWKAFVATQPAQPFTAAQMNPTPVLKVMPNPTGVTAAFKPTSLKGPTT